MSDMNMYNILGKFNNLDPKLETVEETAKEVVYENVESRGDIMEAVKSLEEKYMGFKESAKPDYIDLDKDGDRKESMKKAAKDAKKKTVKEGEYDPAPVDPEAVAKRKRLQAIKDRQEAERAEKGDDYKSKSKTFVPGKAYGGAAQKDDAEKDDLDEAMGRGVELNGKPVNVNSIEVDGVDTKDYPDFADAYVTYAEYADGTPLSDDELDQLTDEHGDLVNQAAHGNLQGMADFANLDEVAPPGAKAERMVKHIKKGYAKDGKLTKKEKGIAYATAWKAHNAGKVEEGTEFGDTIANSKAELKKADAKLTKVTESRMLQEGDYVYEKVAKALAERDPTLNTADSSFVTAVRKEMVAQGIEPNRARNIIMMDDDFISDVATSYGHYCKEIAECGGPINSFVEESPMVDAQQELDEIARLAGLPDRLPNPGEPGGPPGEIDLDVKKLKTSNDDKEEMDETSTGAAIGGLAGAVLGKSPAAASAGAQIGNMITGPEEVEEGNEFTKARLDAIAAGKDTFTVGDKTYKVSGDTKHEKSQVAEDINVNITASGEEDALNLVRKLAGLQTVDHDEGHEVDLDEERKEEWDNTPEEKVAPTSAAIPSGNDLHKSKRQDPGTANKAANPLSENADVFENLWEKYENIINDIKA